MTLEAQSTVAQAGKKARTLTWAALNGGHASRAPPPKITATEMLAAAAQATAGPVPQNTPASTTAGNTVVNWTMPGVTASIAERNNTATPASPRATM